MLDFLVGWSRQNELLTSNFYIPQWRELMKELQSPTLMADEGLITRLECNFVLKSFYGCTSNLRNEMDL